MVPDGFAGEGVDVGLPFVGGKDFAIGVELLAEPGAEGSVGVADLEETR